MIRPLIIIVYLFSVCSLYATGDTVFFHSMKNALQQPEKVYKLSLSGPQSGNELAQFGKLINLAELEINDCRLESLPSEIFLLSKLKKLTIANNKLLNAVPADIEKLGQLQYLKIYHNSRIKELPSSIGNLGNLYSFSVEENDSLLLLPFSIGNLSGLKDLRIWHNIQLKTITPGIGNLHNLDRLTLDGVGNYSIPDEIGNMEQLDYLFIRSVWDAPLTLPSSIGKLAALKTLVLSGNIGEIPPGWEQLPVEYLKLAYTHFTLFPKECCLMKNLRTIELENNSEMTGFPPEVKQLSALVVLRLENNNLLKLETLENFSTCKQLKKIDLSKSKFQQLPSQITSITSVCSINLSQVHNENSNVDWNQVGNVLSKFRNLEKIDFSHNRMDKLPSSFAKLTQVDTFIFDEVYGAALADLSILKKTHVRVLSLRRCSLEQLPKNIELLESLEAIDLSENKLTTVEAQISKLVKLKKLNLRAQANAPSADAEPDNEGKHSTLVNISPAVSGMRSLVVLDLRNNPKIIEQAKKLEADLSNCQVLYN